MINFQYLRAGDAADAVRQTAADPGAKFIAGGTNLIDLMKEEVERPTRLIDITRLPLRSVEETAEGGVRIGALVPNSDLAYHLLIERRYPIRSIRIGASFGDQVPKLASEAWKRRSEGATLEGAGAELQFRHCHHLPTCVARATRRR